MERRPAVVITGSSGLIGEALVSGLAPEYAVFALDRNEPVQRLPSGATFIRMDVASEDSVERAVARLGKLSGGRIASVIHLAAYFDLSGEPSPLYEQVTVRGTERLLRALRALTVEQFVFSGSMLEHAPGKPGQVLSEESPLDPRFPYRASKIQAERVVHNERGTIPAVLLRLAGVYHDRCGNPFLAHQIARIFERDPKGHFYPADPATGQSFIHIEDVTDAIGRLIERRHALPAEVPLLLGEPEALGYADLQSEISRLAHGHDWLTRQIPAALAKGGVWLEDEVLAEDNFLKPWMVAAAGDHYALDITRARTLLGWQPRHSLRGTLPRMIASLKQDPVGWYRANRLPSSKVAGLAAVRLPTPDAEPGHHEHMQQHMREMREMRIGMGWTYWVTIGLGLWLATAPFAFGAFEQQTFAASVMRVTEERGLWEPAVRNALNGWSDIAAGFLLMAFGALSLSARFRWAPWGTTAVGVWLLFAPLLFWTPSAAAYNNDTLVGALAIAFSILIPMMPGMSHEGMMDDSDTPPGWTYCPSTYLQRLPIIVLGLVGFVIARQLAAYQLGHADGVWEPFFAGQGGRNGTETIITSDVSKAWPIADGGLGAVSYIFEVLMGVMGDRRRWRTMPWMVFMFAVVVGPLGVISIYFIIIQPIVIGTYCSLCLLAAAAMLVMIPYMLDEVVAMVQFQTASTRRGRPFWRTFFMGDAMPGGGRDDKPGVGDAVPRAVASALRGVTVPWTLAASVVLGVWIMFSRLTFGTVPPMADSDHLVGALVVTTAVIAMAEVTRAARFLNLLFAAWLVAAPWLLDGAGGVAAAHSVIAGIVLAGLSLPRGRLSGERYGGWDRYVV